MSIITRLEVVRVALELSNKDMAAIMKIDPNTYSSLKSGKRKLQVEELSIIKDKLNISPAWLLFGDGDRFYNSKIQSSKLTLLIADAYASYDIDLSVEESLLLEIANKILIKIYLKYNYKNHQGEHFHLILFKILRDVKYYTGRENNAKENLLKIIKEFNDKTPNLKKVKVSISLIIETLSSKDCFYILQNSNLYTDLVYKKISIDNKKMIENDNIFLKPLYAPFKWYLNLPEKHLVNNS